MIRKIVIAALCLASSAFGQAVGGGGVPGAGGGGSGTPGGSTTQGQFNNAGAFAGTSAETFRTADGSLSQLANVQYLSASSEIGAQCTAAVTALGSAGGVIQLPNSTSLTMTTTCANIPPTVSIHGYGKLATIITCSVAGDCFSTLNNPTTNGEIGAVISDFAINPSGASGQVLMHLKGASGYTLHDLQFAPYATGPAAATCLEFDNSAPGIFTERTRTYNVYLERTCTIGVLFNVAAGADPSFAYDTFEFGVVSAGANYAIVFNGSGRMYGGSLSVTANHVGPGGGILQYNNDFSSAGLSNNAPGENVMITAEENGSGAGVVLSATGTSVLLLSGTIFNGSSSANALATTFSIAGGALFNLQQPAVNTDSSGAKSFSGVLTIKPDTSADGKLKLVPFGSSTPTYTLESSNGGNIFEFTQAGTGAGASTIPFLFYGAPFAGLSSQVGTQIPDAGCYQFGDGTSFVVDTQICRTSAGGVTVRTPASASGGSLTAGTLNVAAARKGTFVCTGAGTITISNANEAATSDVIISMNTAGGTITTPPAMKTVTAATGFTVLCGATDTSTYNYDILN